MAWKKIEEAVQAELTLTTVCEVIVEMGAWDLWVDISNGNAAGDYACDQFTVAFKGHEGGTYAVVADATSDYTKPFGTRPYFDYPIKWCSTDLTTLAKNGDGLLNVRIHGLYSVRLQAACSGGGASDTAITCRWQQV